MNKRNVTLAIVLVLVLSVMFSDQLKELVYGPSDEKIIQILNEKGPKMKIQEPNKGDKVKPSFTVKGTAKLPGQYIRAIITDDKNDLLDRGTISIPLRNNNWTEFSVPIAYTGKYRGKAALEVYWIDTRNGNRTDVTKIPVILE